MDGPSEPKRKRFDEVGCYEFVRSPPSYIQMECSICLSLLCSPHLTSCCGQNFCEECIATVRRSGSPCPLCNKAHFTVVYNRAHHVTLKELEIYCTNREGGCEWRGSLDSLDKHLNLHPEPTKQLEGCPFAEIVCRYEACGELLPRHLLDQHQMSSCPQRPYTCEHCEYESTYIDITTGHYDECELFPVQCLNKCRPDLMPRCDLEEHLDMECPLQEVECEFSYAGCEIKLPRRDIDSHMSSMDAVVKHVSLLAQENKRLNQQNVELTVQNAKLTAQLASQKKQLASISEHLKITPLTIVFPNYSEHRRNKTPWYSHYFYSHLQGYKVKLRVDANGWGEGANTHLSCYIHIEHGEFDDKLKWPFQGVIGINLISHNPTSRESHREIKFRTCPRVPLPSSGLGFDRFIFRDHRFEEDFVTDDCLHFYVIIRTIRQSVTQ